MLYISGMQSQPKKKRTVRVSIDLDNRLRAAVPEEMQGSRDTEIRVAYAIREWLDSQSGSAKQAETKQPT